MMVQAFEQALPDVHDEKLREDMLGFMGQELLHAEAHDEVMNQVFTRHGIDPAPFNRQMQYFFRRTLGIGDDSDPRAIRQRLNERLGICASSEHMFAFVGDWALNADLEKFGADPQMLDLLSVAWGRRGRASCRGTRGRHVLRSRLLSPLYLHDHHVANLFGVGCSVLRCI